MHIGGMIFTGLCAIAASVVSVHFFVDPSLEYRVVQNADATLEVRGGVYAGQELVLQDVSRTASYPFERYFGLFPEEASFSQDIIAEYFITPKHERLYVFDERGYWRPLYVQEHDGYGTVRLARGGDYALGSDVHVQIPVFIDELEALRYNLPINTTSYTISLLAQVEQGEPFFVRDVERGGCGALPTLADTVVSYSSSRTVQVLVNDVLREVTFTFFVEAGTTPLGCVEDMPLQVIL